MVLFPTIVFILTGTVTVVGHPTPFCKGKTSTRTASLLFKTRDIVFTALGAPCVTPLTKNSKLLLTLPVAVNKKGSPAQAVFAALSLVSVAGGEGPAETVIVTTLLMDVQETPEIVFIA